MTPNGARSLLVMEADAPVDAYAQVLERALTTYQGRIKPDEVRSLFLWPYIQAAVGHVRGVGKRGAGSGSDFDPACIRLIKVAILSGITRSVS